MRVKTMLPILFAACLSVASCSDSGDATGRDAPVAPTTPVASASPSASAAPPRAKPAAAPGSRVLGKSDRALRGKPACEVRFVYAGHAPENLFWEEPCSAVTAAMVTRGELEKLNRWNRLDDFARKFVAALPGGRVLYVEGGASASVYPIGTTGTYEVPVAD